MRSREPMAAAESADLLDTPDAGPAAIRGGMIRVVGYGAGVAITAISAALLFRHLGVNDSGRYVTVLALVSIVAGLTDAGLTGVGMRELVVRKPSERESLLRNLIGMRIVLGVVGLAGAVVFAALAGYSSAMVVGTALAGVGTVLQTFQNTLAVQLMVDLRLGWVTVLELVRQVVTVVGIVVLVLVGASLVPFLALLIPASLVSVGDDGLARARGHAHAAKLRLAGMASADPRCTPVRRNRPSQPRVLPARADRAVARVVPTGDRLLRGVFSCYGGADGHPAAGGGERLPDLRARRAGRPRALRLRRRADVPCEDRARAWAWPSSSSSGHRS